MTDEAFLRRAIALSAEAARRSRCEPFGAVVVKDNTIIGEGFNRAAERHDPTSHGEIEAIRDACANLATTDLSGCVLYTSCEPCALCVAAIHIARIERVVFAASLAESEAALSTTDRPASDIAGLRAEAGSAIGMGRVPANSAFAEEAVAVLKDWAGARRE